ncbi:MAG: type II secretion system F family protein [Candidatus Pacearchaeota archaeon]
MEEGSKRKISEEIAKFSIQFEKSKNPEDKKLIKKHIEDLKNKLKKSEEVFGNLKKFKPLKETKTEDVGKEDKIERKKIGNFLSHSKQEVLEEKRIDKSLQEEILNSDIPEEFRIGGAEDLEKLTLKRIRKKSIILETKKAKKASDYVKFSSNLFSNISRTLEKKRMFTPLKRDLIKANLQFIPASYISVILFTTLLSLIFSIFVLIFFLFFNIGAELPIITFVGGELFNRFLKVFWIIFVIPLSTFLFMYYYPSMEKKSAEDRINQELPFATIHMAAVSGSMIDPTNIFKIIIATGEYEYLEKEFIKLINEINIYGYDLVGALRRSAFNSPSKRLSELFNGLATTITSGGNLPGFFEKRSQSLLFEYRLEREKYTRSAETFMDIYISVVIAAPMILMLLLIMMSVSGLGISLGANMIALIMILGVSLINILFLTFLNLRQPAA